MNNDRSSNEMVFGPTKRLIVAGLFAFATIAFSGCCCPIAGLTSDRTVGVYRGNGTDDTQAFEVNDDWEYEFEAKSDDSYRLVEVYNADTGEAGRLNDSGDEFFTSRHVAGGRFFIRVTHVTSKGGPWKITVRQGSNRVD